MAIAVGINLLQALVQVGLALGITARFAEDAQCWYATAYADVYAETYAETYADTYADTYGARVAANAASGSDGFAYRNVTDGLWLG